MSELSQFFLRNIPGVFFFYGLSFFSMGLAILLELGHSSELDFGNALKPLAAFGLIHGCHEWFEMFLLLNPQVVLNPANAWISMLRILLLATSFLCLVAFGARLIAGPGRARLQWGMMGVVSAVWILGLIWVISTQPPGPSRIIAADVYTRYSLAIPGAVLSVWGLLLQRRRFFQAGMRSFGQDATLAAVAFALYGGIGQLFASSSVIFPSEYLNADVFVRTFGIPIQVFRAAMACFAAIFIIRSLRAFEEENRRHIEALREAQLTERRRLEATRAELLHRTVLAQEAERQRIARELHDETGQTLTALGLGLRGLSEMIGNNPQRAVQQATQLETLTVNGLEELQRMVSGLHPPQLDDLGLLAALRWYGSEVTKRTGLQVNVGGPAHRLNFTLDERVVFFRIAQEAITNVVRHASATQAWIWLERNNGEVRLTIKDDGRGFDAEKTLNKDVSQPHWGLLGMIERAALIGGSCRITSQPGEGTCVEVSVQREEEDG